MSEDQVLGLEPESRPRARSCRCNEQSQDHHHHGRSLHDRELEREPPRIYCSEETPSVRIAGTTGYRTSREPLFGGPCFTMTPVIVKKQAHVLHRRIASGTFGDKPAPDSSTVAALAISLLLHRGLGQVSPRPRAMDTVTLLLLAFSQHLVR